MSQNEAVEAGQRRRLLEELNQYTNERIRLEEELQTIEREINNTSPADADSRGLYSKKAHLTDRIAEVSASQNSALVRLKAMDTEGQVQGQ